ncbi:unnamed protein product [Notodromas monacha]|uniref:Potassium channel domain-containing protein n=1 Tax=Notodromas monacha TaxID=399045 RepID=A0A7R9G9A4_9CRUS|nr:unnamed protein product [Notodromas monacha]CAG0914091.1 unnamed protein product [Notodromas monacha]
MSAKNWSKIAGLTFAFVAVLLVGSGVFMVLETTITRRNHTLETEEWRNFTGSVKLAVKSDKVNLTQTPAWDAFGRNCKSADQLKDYFANWTTWKHDPEGLLHQVMMQCENATHIIIEVDEVSAWDLLDAVFFSMTVVTTIGYGHRAPKSDAGRLFCIVYALIGIPVTGLLLAALADTFSLGLMYVYDRGFTFWKERVEPDIMGEDVPDEPSETEMKRHKLMFAAVVYICIGFSVLMFLPALLFSLIEGWSYGDSLYFTFVTLSTIGFGDLVPGEHVTNKNVDALYKIVMTMWVVIGLAYWATVFSFITKALRRIRLKAVNVQARIALQQLGFVQRERDPVFVSENSKMTIDLMIKMAHAMAATGRLDEAEETSLRSGLERAASHRIRSTDLVNSHDALNMSTEYIGGDDRFCSFFQLTACHCKRSEINQDSSAIVLLTETAVLAVKCGTTPTAATVTGGTRKRTTDRRRRLNKMPP